MHLEMRLKAGVAAFQGDAVMLDVKLVRPPNLQFGRTTAQPRYCIVERVVARRRRHVAQLEVRQRDGRQDAGHERLCTHMPDEFPHVPHHLIDRVFDVTQAPAIEALRRQVELEVEFHQLGDDPRVGVLVEHLLDHMGRLPPVVDQKKLLLGPDAADARLKHVLTEHIIERPNVLDQLAREPSERRLVLPA